MIITERLLPHDLDAEKAVLGAVLLDGLLFDQAAMVGLKADDFYLENHRAIWRGMSRAADEAGESGAIDMVTLRAALRVEDEARNFDAAYLSGLIDGLPRYSNIEHYARIVKDKSLLRRLICAGTAIVEECYLGELDGRQALEGALERFIALEGERSGTRLRSMMDSEGELAEDYEQWATGQGNEDEVVRAPWSALQRFDLFLRGNLTILAALTSMGKTMFLTTLALRAAQAGYRVLFFSREDGGRRLRRRMLAALTRVPYRELMRRRIASDELLQRSARGIDLMRALPVWIADDTEFGVEEMLAMARGQAARGGADLIIVDYLQQFELGDNRVRELGEMLGKLRGLARKLNAHVIVASQFNRGAAAKDLGTGDYERPQLRHLRDSGEIEQRADVVAFLHRKSYFDEEKRGEMGLTEFIMAKNRDGETGIGRLVFSGEFQAVYDCADEPEATELPGMEGSGDE